MHVAGCVWAMVLAGAACEPADWSGIPQRPFRDITKGQDRLYGLCELSSQMVVAGEKPQAQEMLEKGTAMLKY